MLADAKSRGLNIKDTRLTDPAKLDLLMALLTLALVWAGRTAAELLGPRERTRKSHGHPAQSWFRIDFLRLRNLLRTDPADAARTWQIRTSKPLRTGGVV